MTSRVATYSRICVHRDIQSSRIDERQRIVQSISVEIYSSTELGWVFADEPLQRWGVIARSVVVDAGSVVFSAGVFVGVGGTARGDRAVTKWLVGVLSQRAAATVS